jgi:hypothetical protein
VTARAAALLVLVGFVLAGCGGNSNGSADPAVAVPTAPSTPIAAPTPIEQSSSPAPAVSSEATKFVGDVTLRASGVDVKESMYVGPIMYATHVAPPTEDFAACNEDFTTFLQGAGFAATKLTFVEHGSFPEQLTVSGSNGYNANTFNRPMQANLVLDVGGTTICDATGSETGGIPVTLNPGQSVTLTGLILFPGALSNANPVSIPRIFLNEFSPIGFGSADFGGPGTTVAFSGPQVAVCEGDKHLLPFAHLPVSSDGGCKKAP